jgi:hypothetical protein
MGLDSLLCRIEIVTPVTAVTFSDVTLEPLLHKAVTPVTSVTPEIIVTATEAKKEADTIPYWRWRVVFADGSTRIAAFSPPASWEEVLEFYPAAVSGSKIPDDYQFKEASKHGNE